MSRKDTVLRILIVVGVLYTALLVVMIIFFSMSIHVLSGLRISYENNIGGQESEETPVSAPVENEEGEDVVEEDTTTMITFPNVRCDCAFEYPSNLKTQSGAADSGDAEATPYFNTFYLYDPLVEEPYLNRYLNFEILGIAPSLSGFTSEEATIGSRSATKYTSNESRFDVYHVELDGDLGVLELYISKESEKQSVVNEILSSFVFGINY